MQAGGKTTMSKRGKDNGLAGLSPKLRPYFSKRREVLAVYAFGSMVKGKNFRARELDLSSDLDLGVLLDPRFRKSGDLDWQLQLSSDLGSRLRQEVDVVVLNRASLGLVHEILRTGKRVYEKPNRRNRREEAELIIKALDFLPVKELIERKAIERIKAFHG